MYSTTRDDFLERVVTFLSGQKSKELATDVTWKTLFLNAYSYS